jgi:hypothetical protein
MKSLFSFSSGQTEKNSWKKMGKTKFLVWWIDVTNKIKVVHIPDCPKTNSQKLHSFFWILEHCGVNDSKGKG